MTFALHDYFVVESFNHLGEFENWDISDSDVSSFNLDTDSILGRYSANYVHESNTNQAQVYREFNNANIDFDTDYTYLFIWARSNGSTLSHSGSEGFGLSDGTNTDYFHFDTTKADDWEIFKKTLASPDDDNGADLTAVTKILYQNNNSASDLNIGFVCVAENKFTFDSSARINKPVGYKEGQNISKQKIPNGNNLISALGKSPRSFSLKIMLNKDDAYSKVCQLEDIAKQKHPWLFESDWWFMPVTITSFNVTDNSSTTTMNKAELSLFEVNMSFKEHCGD
jgi:hypothetical protein